MPAARASILEPAARALHLTAELQCQICGEPFNQPVNLPCGHTSCKSCIGTWLRGGRDRGCPQRCPQSVGCNPKTLPPSITVKQLLAVLPVHCRWGLTLDEEGEWVPGEGLCPAELAGSDIPSHERACSFAHLLCPFTGCGSVLKLSSVSRHNTSAAKAHAEGELAKRVMLEARLAALSARSPQALYAESVTALHALRVNAEFRALPPVTFTVRVTCCPTLGGHVLGFSLNPSQHTFESVVTGVKQSFGPAGCFPPALQVVLLFHGLPLPGSLTPAEVGMHAGDNMVTAVGFY